jgi:FKBP-type peptidyl-prolyl cis-trans isomerase
MSKGVLLAGGACVLLLALAVVAVIMAIMGTEVIVADENKDEKVITTASGLKYVEIKIGEGKESKAGSTVKVFYAGRFENGKPFDSNVGGEAYDVLIGKTSVIQGWHEGLQGMKPGGKRKLIIPPDLAYGKKGTPDGRIPPNSTLIFEVEVTEVK